MTWKRYEISTTTEAEYLIADMLADLGVEGVELDDNVPPDDDSAGIYIDVMPDLPPDDGTAEVIFYMDGDTPAEESDRLLASVEAGLSELSSITDIGSGIITVGETEDQDWINNWKQYFKPFMVGDIVIKPTWEDLPPELDGKVTLEIDPGTAFGTGSHETTQLCLVQLEKYIKPGDAVLDIGTGSGILGIAAIKLGAARVFGTDLDGNAVTTAKENVAVNHIPAEIFPVVTGNLLDDEQLRQEAGLECYDIVVSNILAPVIIDLTGEADRHLKHGGFFIASGIIDTKESDVLEAFARHPEWEVLETDRQGEWVSVTARRR